MSERFLKVQNPLPPRGAAQKMSEVKASEMRTGEGVMRGQRGVVSCPQKGCIVERVSIKYELI